MKARVAKGIWGKNSLLITSYFSKYLKSSGLGSYQAQ